MPQIQVNLTPAGPARWRCSLHADLGGGGFTVANVLVTEDNGRLAVKMPLVQMGERKRPAVTFQGELKREIELAILAAWREQQK